MARRASFLDYVKKAFFWHWNLLAVGGGAAFAFLSGQPDVFLPLVAAVEIAYLGLLTTNPRFQKSVDARAVATPPPLDQALLMQRVKSVLKQEAWERFEALRQRCLGLNALSQQLRGPQPAGASPVSDMQTESLERLLWMFLKLLYSQDAIQQFLRSTSRKTLEESIAAAEEELKRATDLKRGDKLIRSIQDKLETLKQRMANYNRVEENREFIAMEIERIEQKVNAISELSINARDPNDITAQVDGIAAGISATEEAMRNLDVGPVLEYEEAPRLLRETH
ncbi:MAG: hypothetical protein IT365_20245 [Candidatus Hydrogenedentes bacterium]|nr:hypothetical protein [Candidatus Hydrogenedentota bacterium]